MNKKLKCDICGTTENTIDMFRCYECRRICCDTHTDDDYAVCLECREDE